MTGWLTLSTYQAEIFSRTLEAVGERVATNRMLRAVMITSRYRHPHFGEPQGWLAEIHALASCHSSRNQMIISEHTVDGRGDPRLEYTTEVRHSR